jgi:hypothetical protein
MQRTYFWHKLHLHSGKIILIATALLLVSLSSYGQRKRWAERNNPTYDQRKLTYGFLIGLHSSMYQVKYSDQFVTQDFDTVHSVIGNWKPGFALGFIVNYKLTDFLDLRLTPTVAFLEHSLTYVYTDDTPRNTQLVETTMVEFPVLLKYKSERRGNIRMYTIGGIKPSIEASGKKDFEGSSTVEVKGGNMSLEAGIGFDLYYPLFKFSPEIRFSRGIVDVLDNRNNIYGQPLRRLNTNTITIYFLFQ